MKKILLNALLLIISITAYSATPQLGTIKGVVVDSQTKETLPFVSINIKTKLQPSLVKGGVTDQTGLFILGGLKEGTYTINVSSIGYKSFQKEFVINAKTQMINLKSISLIADNHVLKDVEVVGQKAQMKFDIDKKVFNVDQNIASAGGSASDVLSNIPSVEVSNEGDVSLRGNGNVTVWINGKASGLSADNRAQILEQMPAGSIAKIEVITNPSAKYSPEGTAGIINIILKEDRKPGYFGSVQAGISTTGGYNGSFDINCTTKKFDVFANIGYRERQRSGGSYSDRIYTNDNTFLNQQSTEDGSHSGLFVRGGVTYHLTPKDHFNVGAFGMFGDRKSNSLINYQSNVVKSFKESIRTTDSDNSMDGKNAEFGYRHEFSKDSYLNFTASYNNWHMDGTGIYNQEYLNPVAPSLFQRQESDMRHHNWEFQVDYENKISEASKFEVGYKGTLGKSKSPVETYGGETAATAIFKDQLFNNFIYDQDIHALYTTYSGRINKLGYQAGLRGEYSKTNAHSYDFLQNDYPFSKDYFSLFPSAYLSYSLSKTDELQLNYTKRISRPWGPQLNSFKNISDPTNVSFGNPELAPEYSHAFELNYIKNWSQHTLSVSAYYRSTDNVIQSIRFLDGKTMNTTYANVTKNQSAGLELVGKNKFFRILDLTSTVNLFYYKLDGFTYQPKSSVTGEVLQPIIGSGNNNFAWNARMIANVILPQAISLQLTGSYNSKQIIAQGTQKANYSLDAGIKKSFMNKKISLSINARDILNSRIQESFTSGTGFYQNAKNWRNGRQVGFTLTYSFGNSRSSNKKQIKRADNDSNMVEPMGDE